MRGMDGRMDGRVDGWTQITIQMYNSISLRKFHIPLLFLLLLADERKKERGERC